MLAGLIYPTKGLVKVLGFTPFERKNEYLSQIALVMVNKAGLNWDLTSKQSFSLISGIYQIPNSEFLAKLNYLTKMLEVEDYLDTQVRKLSLGQRMKMEIIGALLHSPKVLFLDEPTIGLDIISKRKIRDFLRTIQKQMQVTILLTSHDMDDVETVCDRVVIINEGQKVYDNTLERLMDKHKNEKFIKFTTESDINMIEIDTLEFEIIENSKNSVLFKSSKEKLAELINQISKNNNLIDIEIVSVPLEEIISEIFLAQ